MPPLRHRYRDPIALSAPIARMPFRSPIIRAVAALCLTQLIGWGATFYLPAVTGPADGHGRPTIMLVIMAAVSWPLSAVFERHGTRPVMAFGSAIGAIGLMLMGLANGSVSYVLSWIILGLAGACMLTTPAQIAVSEVAGEKTHQALGVLILAGGLTSTIIWPLTGLAQAQWGWRATTLAYAALMLLVCAPLHWMTLARKRKGKTATKATSEPASIDGPNFTLLAASFAGNGFITWGFALTIIILFEAAGLDHAGALTAAAFIGLARWAGRLSNFVGGGHGSGFFAGLAGSALFPLSFIVLLMTSNLIGAMLFATLYGVASGITAVNRATLPLQIFPAGAYARASARLAVPLNLSFAAAPPVFTVIMTSAGPHAALWLAFAISIFAFFTLLCLMLRHGGMRHPLQPD